MKYLLDTCSFLWLTGDDSKLSSNARAILEDRDNDIFLSAASSWEVVVKYKIGKLALPKPPEEFLYQARLDFDLLRLSMSERAVMKLVDLPAIHTDPWDRMLVCQAQAHRLVVISSDSAIRQYPVTTVW